MYLCLVAREFGYIARNPQSQLHQCHVFRCDIAAMGIAQVMLDNHKVYKTKHASTTNLGTLGELTSVPPLYCTFQLMHTASVTVELSLLLTPDGTRASVLVSLFQRFIRNNCPE